jgi:hypothetical protein
MRPRFQADADLNHKIVLGLRRREPLLDIWSAAEGDVVHRSDPEILAIASEAGRIVLSHDRRTMPSHLLQWISHSTSPGLIIVSQSLDVGSAIDDILLIWTATEAREWMNQVGFVPL